MSIGRPRPCGVRQPTALIAYPGAELTLSPSVVIVIDLRFDQVDLPREPMRQWLLSVPFA